MSAPEKDKGAAEDKRAVLLLAYGGPDKLEDVPAYLLDIRGGRETPQELVDEITHRYGEIGGRSPLLEITNSAAAQLQEQLGIPVYAGMRHWYPYIKDVVAQMAADGVQQGVAGNALAAFEVGDHSFGRFLDTHHFLVQAHGDARIAEMVRQRFDDFLVCEFEQARTLFDDHHTHAEHREHARVFDTDDAAAHHDQRFGNRRHVQNLVAINDRAAVDGHARRTGRLGAGGDDDGARAVF